MNGSAGSSSALAKYGSQGDLKSHSQTGKEFAEFRSEVQGLIQDVEWQFRERMDAQEKFLQKLMEGFQKEQRAEVREQRAEVLAEVAEQLAKARLKVVESEQAAADTAKAKVLESKQDSAFRQDLINLNDSFARLRKDLDAARRPVASLESTVAGLLKEKAGREEELAGLHRDVELVLSWINENSGSGNSDTSVDHNRGAGQDAGGASPAGARIRQSSPEEGKTGNFVQRIASSVRARFQARQVAHSKKDGTISIDSRPVVLVMWPEGKKPEAYIHEDNLGMLGIAKEDVQASISDTVVEIKSV